MDSQSSPTPPVERKIIGINKEESEGLQEAFIRYVLGEHTTDSTRTHSLVNSLRNIVH